MVYYLSINQSISSLLLLHNVKKQTLNTVSTRSNKRKKRDDKNSTMLIHINLGGKGCLRIRPQGVFQVKQPPYIKNNNKIYIFFNRHKLGKYKLFW